MADNQKTVFVDDEVASRVIDIVQEARQHVIFVSPYLELWGHARTALALAAKRKVKVTVIIRNEEWNSKTRDNITWLLDNGIRVLAADYLHAKIYLNERSVFLSSMNLTEFSTKNSLEIGLALGDEEVTRQVRGYVTNTLLQLAKPVNTPRTEPWQQPAHRPPQPQPQRQSQTVTGTCIRCGRPLYPNPDKPLCDDCYDEWAEYQNVDYQERFCHICGRPWETSYAKPLCGSCFRKVR